MDDLKRCPDCGGKINHTHNYYPRCIECDTEFMDDDKEENPTVEQLMEIIKAGVICPVCRGGGSVFKEPRAISDPVFVTCKSCNGTGRLHSPEMIKAMEGVEG